MVFRNPAALLAYALWRTLRLLAVVALFAICLFAAASYAQNVDVAPPAPGDAATSIVGWAMKLGLLGFVALASWAALKLSGFLTAKQQQAQAGTAASVGWSLTNRIWVKAQSIASKLYSRERALVEKILADGQVTPEEFSELKQKVLVDLKEVIVPEIPLLGPVLKLVGERDVNGFLEGIAAKVTHNVLAGGGSPPTPLPPPDAPSPL